jgi:SOS-response transcriptional repressor LexA
MPHALTNRQREYLQFIREYIKINESSPRLEEIADHFGVASPTANKTLKALQKKGVLYFKRDKVSGYYIRTPERYIQDGTLREIMVTGILDRYGEVLEFPKYHRHFPYVLPEGTGDVFALDIYQHIPSAKILGRDIMIFINGIEAKPGDICIFPYGERNFLVRMYAMDFSEDTPFYQLAIGWENLKDDYEGYLFWWPLTENEETTEYLAEVVYEQEVHWGPIPPDRIIGKALRLVRRLAI